MTADVEAAAGLVGQRSINQLCTAVNDLGSVAEPKFRINIYRDVGSMGFDRSTHLMRCRVVNTCAMAHGAVCPLL